MKEATKSDITATFWDHLEALRWVILRIIAILLVMVITIFMFRDFLFNDVILPPLRSDFVFYRWLCAVGDLLHFPAICPENFNIHLINIELAGQFMTHISVTIMFSIVLLVPYLIYEIWRFIAPALYPNERKNVGWIFVSSAFLFYIGAAISYFIIFPLTVRFLGGYTVSDLIPNQISIQSYIGALYVLVFAIGLMFEMPILAYFLSRAGILEKKTMRKFRSYALLVILILAAIITPTTDPFTMCAVALPLYLLYEVSIWVCKK